MNPLDMRGPDFLSFYIATAAVTFTVIWFLRRLLGPGGMPPRRLTDPYAIAQLRGGPEEAIRIAVGGLIERGLLEQDGTVITAVEGATATDGVEQAILRASQGGVLGYGLLRNAMVRNALAERISELEEQGLTPDAGLRGQLRALGVIGLLLLGGLAATKILVALDRGHTNVLFLLILGIICVVLMGRQIKRLPWATPRGRRVLDELRQLFGALRGHTSRERIDEMLFIAAIFGLSHVHWGHLQSAFKPPEPASSSSCGSSSSSCSSSSSSCSSSSCGSSCGGGGCGGCGS